MKLPPRTDPKSPSRRCFLQLAAAGSLFAGLSATGLSPLHAADPIKRTGAPRLRLSLAAFSFRDFFKDVNRGRKSNVDAARRIDLFDFIDYCAEQGCDGAELTSYYFPPTADRDYMLKIKRHAFLRGISISGSSVGNNFALPLGAERSKEIADVKAWIDMCEAMGAPHIRVFAGTAKGHSEAEARKLCIGALQECCDYAGSKGIFLGLENHGGIVAEPEGMLEIVAAVKSPYFGVNLDSGNFHGEDPYAELAKIAPYSVNVQIKVEIRRKGQTRNEPSDLLRLIRILRDVGYQGFVALEYEAAPDPFETVPGVLKQLRAAFAS